MGATVYEARRLSRLSIALNGVWFAWWAVVVLALADAGSGAAQIAAGVLGLGWLLAVVSFVRWLVRDRGRLAFDDQAISFGDQKLYYRDLKDVRRGSADVRKGQFFVVLDGELRTHEVNLLDYQVGEDEAAGVLDEIERRFALVRARRSAERDSADRIREALSRVAPRGP